MRKKMYAVVKTAIMLLTILSLVIVANAGYSSLEKQNIKTTGNNPISQFYAEISFYLYEGVGCEECPVRFAPIVAQGLDTDHSASGETDSYGFLLLELEFDATYRITVQTEIFETVIIDFIVIDDQTIKFHLQEEEVSVSNIPILQKFVQLLNIPKN